MPVLYPRLRIFSNSSLVLDDAIRVVEEASKRSIIISLEYHNNTLTDTLESTLNLLEAVDSPYFQSFWQPVPAGTWYVRFRADHESDWFIRDIAFWSRSVAQPD